MMNKINVVYFVLLQKCGVCNVTSTCLLTVKGKHVGKTWK